MNSIRSAKERPKPRNQASGVGRKTGALILSVTSERVCLPLITGGRFNFWSADSRIFFRSRRAAPKLGPSGENCGLALLSNGTRYNLSVGARLGFYIPRQ